MPDRDLLEDYDAERRMWRKDAPGHTLATKDLTQVHEARFTAQRLHGLAVRGELGRVDAAGVLRALIALQDRTGGDRHGCLRWYAEETVIHDTNAAFFVGLPLMVVRLKFADGLTPDALAALDDLLGEMRVWFRREVTDGKSFYPNKYLGDLVCAWLLVEIFGEDGHTATLTDAMARAAAYWRDEHWGWGEHMSDIYTTVMLNELSALLLAQKRLPAELYDAYRDLMGELLAIDDVYGLGPRVPAVRSYNFESCPARKPYRHLGREYGHPLGDFGPRQYDGWNALAPPETPVAQDVRIPCFGGCVAVARIHDDCRLGSLSLHQFMPDVDKATYGLVWQSFPVAFWRPLGDWGFLQFMTQQGDRVRCHPAESRTLSMHDNALTTDRDPVLVGETRSHQDGDQLTVQRRLPAISPLWDRAVDRWRVLDLDPAATVTEHADGVDIRYPERTLSIRVLPGPGGTLRITRAGRRLDVDVEWTSPTMADRDDLTAQWHIHLIPNG